MTKPFFSVIIHHNSDSHIVLICKTELRSWLCTSPLPPIRFYHLPRITRNIKFLRSLTYESPCCDLSHSGGHYLRPDKSGQHRRNGYGPQPAPSVPGATIKVTNIGTNQVRTVTAAGNGAFSVADLEPVEYRLEVSAQGFKKEVIDNIKVDTASIATVNIKMEPGSVDTKITVQASAVMIDTSSGTLSSTVTQRQIEDAPLLNRSVLDLALTLPNVGGDAGSEDPVILSATPCPGCNLTLGGGGSPMSTMIMADGTNNTGVSLWAVRS